MILVRPEHVDDGDAVRRVNEAAFGRPDEADLVDRLRRQVPSYLGLVAVIDGDVVGHIAFTPVTLEPAVPTLDARGLAPLAVLPSHQRLGVGSTLVHEGLAACRRAGADIVVVLGHSQYYSRFGFQPATSFGLESAFDVPPEAFMVLTLVPGVRERVEGIVRYHAAFVN